MCPSRNCLDTVPPMSARATPGTSGSPDDPDHPDRPERSSHPDRPDQRVRMTAWVRGQVQGVGFRWFTRATALRLGGIEGFAANLGDGRVQVVAEGPRARCDELLDWLRTGDTPGRVDGVTEIWDEPRGGYGGFQIR
jgi:acylphosphatase